MTSVYVRHDAKFYQISQAWEMHFFQQHFFKTNFLNALYMHVLVVYSSGFGSVWAFQIETGTLRRVQKEAVLVLYAVIKY